MAVIVLTLSPRPGNEGRWSTDMLHDLAEELKHELIKVDDVGLTYIVGGQPQQIRVEPDPELLSLYGITLNQLVDKVRNANRSFITGSLRRDNKEMPVIAGQTLQGRTDVGLLMLTSHDGRPVYVRDVAKVVVGPGIDEHAVWQMLPEENAAGERVYHKLPAVSLAVAKRKGANGVLISEGVRKRLELVRERLIPDEVQVEVTRDFGETAKHKADELMFHLLLATSAIVVIMGLFLGWREGIVVLIVIPATILLTFLSAGCWISPLTASPCLV